MLDWLGGAIMGLAVGILFMGGLLAGHDNREKNECIAKHKSPTCVQVWVPAYLRGED